MAGSFDFVPNGTVPELLPPDNSGTVVTMNGWTFTSKPNIPYQKKFKVTLHGMRWVLNSSTGMFDTTSDPLRNARRLELFYELNGMWDSFTWVHPHMGSMTCRFAEPVVVPKGMPNSNGWIEPFEITLIQHNPGFSTVTLPELTLSALTLSASSITENSAPGTVVGTLSGTIAGSTLSLASDAGGRFAINGSNQIIAGLVSTDYETATSHSITVRETLGAASNSPRDTTFTITVTNVVESSATLNALTLSASSITENSAAGTVVGNILNTTAGSSLSLTSNAGGRFAISGNQIVAGSTATDYETATSHSITIRETLAGATNTPRDTTLTINVTNVNEQPSLGALSLSSSTIAENSAAGTVVGNILGKTAGSTLSLTGNAGNRFALSGTQIVAGSVSTDYETATSHSITIQETLADSPNSPRSTTLTINVSDITEGGSASAISSVEILGVTNLDPDASSRGIDGNGWVAKVTVPFQTGQTFDPTKLSIVVSDPGFNTDGTSTTRNRTIQGTTRLRRQYPNDTSYQQAQVGANLEVYITLSDRIYQGSTIVSASVASSYYGTSAAGTVPVTNNSQRDYPKPMFAWLNTQFERATGTTFDVEAVAYHAHPMNAQMVACVEFYAKDAQTTPNQSATVRATAPALSSFQTQGQIVEAWKASIPLTALTQGDECAAWAVVKPWIGNSWSLETNEGTTSIDAQPQTRLRFTNDKTGAYGGAIAIFDPSASGTGATVTENIGTAVAYNSLPTAVAAIQTYNNANKGHNDLGGGTVYFRNTTGSPVEHELTANITGTGGITWLRVMPHPSNTGSVTLSVQASRTVPDMMSWEVNVRKFGTGRFTAGDTAIGSSTAMRCQNASVAVQAGTSTWMYGAGLVYQRNVTYTDVTGSVLAACLAGHGSTGLRCALALGVITPNNLSSTVNPYVVIGCKGRMNLADYTGNQTTNDGAIVANNYFNSLNTGTGFMISRSFSRGSAVVQNVFEYVSGDSLSFSGDGSAAAIDNFVFMYNSTPPSAANPLTEDMARNNHLYADVASAAGVLKRGVVRFNLSGRWAVKSDVFSGATEGTGRVGNWERTHGVSCIGNTMVISRPVSQNNSDWGGEWRDALSQDNQTYTFTSNQAGISAAGNGTYTLTGTTNGAYNRVPSGLAGLKYDLAGVARRNDGTGANGAYERTV